MCATPKKSFKKYPELLDIQDFLNDFYDNRLKLEVFVFQGGWMVTTLEPILALIKKKK